MTVSDAQAELQAMEFQTCFDDEDSNILVGVRSKFDWDLTATMDVLVFVHEVKTLDLDRMVSDRAKLPTLVNKHFTYGCPPFGFARGIINLVIYYAETVTPEAIACISRRSDALWCQITFVAAQDASQASFLLDQQSTPFFGSALYSDVRYLARRLTGEVGTIPPTRFWLRAINAFVWIYIVLLFVMADADTRFWMIVFFPLGFLVAGARQCYRQRTAPRVNKDELPIV